MNRYSKDSDDNLATFIAGIIILAIVVGIGMGINNVKCKGRWGDSGLPVSWGPVQGCKVQLPDGRWLPEDRIREIDVAPKKSEQ
jgi:hypothetical protein